MANEKLPPVLSVTLDGHRFEVDTGDARLAGPDGAPDWSKILAFVAQVIAMIAQFFAQPTPTAVPPRK